MKKIDVSLNQLKLIVRLKSYNNSVFTVFQPVWKLKHPQYVKFLNVLLSLLKSLTNEVHFVDITGSDEGTEYLLANHITTLPALFIYSNQQIVFKSSVSDSSNNYFSSTQIINLLSSFSTFSSLAFGNNTALSSEQILQAFFEGDVPEFGCLFIAGDKSQVGKSSTCLGILGSLLNAGLHPSMLAYIKPVTQCEAEQPVTKFCKRHGIECSGIGPVVFYKGFTRAYLQHETEPSQVLLRQVILAVQEVSKGKKLVIVDGVGYPSVGSIVSVSNADVAKALNAPVLLVGKSGVGDAIDSYNLNATYFKYSQVRVLGVVFNKLPLTGFYSLDACKAPVLSYFDQFKPNEKVYAFVPIIDATKLSLGSSEVLIANTVSSSEYLNEDNSQDIFESVFIDTFVKNFETSKLLYDLFFHSILNTTAEIVLEDSTFQNNTHVVHYETDSSKYSISSYIVSPSTVNSKSNDSRNGRFINNELVSSNRKRSRDDIEAAAQLNGAKVGG